MTEIEFQYKGSIFTIQANDDRKMKEICDRDIDFKSINVSRENAFEYSMSLGEIEKALNYTYMTNDSVTMYELDGNYNFFYFIMPPSTKILKRFELTYLGQNGILLSYPVDNIIPKYNQTYHIQNLI